MPREAGRPERRIDVLPRVMPFRIDSDGIELQYPINEALRVSELRRCNLSGQAERDVLTEVRKLPAESQDVLAVGIGCLLEELIPVGWAEAARDPTGKR